MASTLVQNLPTGAAKTARSAGRRMNSTDERATQAGGFDQQLKKSVDRKAKQAEDAAPAASERPATESRKPSKTARARERESEADKTQPPAAPDPSEAQGAAVDQSQDSTTSAQEADRSSEQSIAPEPQSADKAEPNSQPAQLELSTANTVVVSAQVASPAVASSSADVASALVQDESGLPTKAPLALVSKGFGDRSEAQPSNADPANVVAAESVSSKAGPAPTEPTSEVAAVGENARPAVAKKQAAVAAEPVAASAPLTVVPDVAPEPGKPKAENLSQVEASNLVTVKPASSTVTAAVDSTPATIAQPSAAQAERFTDVNHPTIVSNVRGQLLPSGGSMQIRLDPPELGALLVQVTVRDGVIDASFQTSNADATQLLSHSLTQLKHSLESQGVSVDKLQVSQAPRGERADQQNDPKNSQQQGQGGFDWERHSNQQRKEMLRRMWAKLGAGDPLDLVA